MEEMKKKL